MNSTRARALSGRWRSARSAWSSATSARARSTPCRRCSTRRPAPGRRLGDERLRGRLDDLLVGDDRRDGHLRPARDARRQRRRGRDHGADHPAAPRGLRGGRRTVLALAALGIFGASLFFGDSMITPAISVLSAVEGVEVVAPSARAPGRADRRWRSSSALFVVQRLGTAAVGRLFGPVMIVWFVVHRRAGRAAASPAPGHPEGAVPDLRAGLPGRPLRHRVLRARRRRPRRDRRRGALRRHGALRPRGRSGGPGCCSSSRPAR